MADNDKTTDDDVWDDAWFIQRGWKLPSPAFDHLELREMERSEDPALFDSVKESLGDKAVRDLYDTEGKHHTFFVHYDAKARPVIGLIRGVRMAKSVVG